MVATAKEFKMGLLAKKLGMSQSFLEDADMVGVSVLQVGPCVVVQKIDKDKNGYSAIRLGFESIEHRKLNRPDRGQFDKNSVKPFRYLKEIRLHNTDAFSAGQELGVELFQVGDTVNVTGVSKGKGFQGVIKRCGKAGGPQSHGSRFHRSTGSIGQRTYPARVFKNTGMPGHMGDVQVTVKNLKVIQVLPEKNLILVKGSVPGSNKSLLVIKSNAADVMSRVKSAPAAQATVEG